LRRISAEENDSAGLKRLALHLLVGSFIINFASLLLYYYGQVRFLADVISQVTLLAVLGYWMLAGKTPKVYLHLANLLVTLTLIASLLLAVTSESGRLEKLNPALTDKVNSLFVRGK